ncbi:MAG: sulfite exporter TauE/SafE family protein [Paracoccaceae bacterium]
MDGVAFWTAAVVASVLVGMSKGGLPAVGMLAVPVLALVINPVAAAGLLLPVYVLSDIFGLYAYRHAFDRRVLAIVVPGMMAGVVFGWATAALVPAWAVTALVGAIGFAFALNILLRPKRPAAPRPARVVPGLFWGSLSGFTSFVSHSGAPPYQVYTLPLGMTKTVFAGTSTIAFAIINAVKLVPYWHLGQLSATNIQVATVLMPVAALAVFVGVRLVQWLPEAAFFRFVTWALLVLSVKLIWDGLSGALA